MRRGLPLFSVVAALTIPSFTYSAYYVSEVFDFNGGAVSYAALVSYPFSSRRQCMHYSTNTVGHNTNACDTTIRWTTAAGHSYVAPGTLVEHIGRHAMDSTTTGCVSDTTTMFRYRVNGSLPGWGTACTGYPETWRSTKVMARSTCADYSETRDDGEGFSHTFASETDLSPGQWAAYRHRMVADLNGSSASRDGCFRVYWW
jgi:hypothetical protein